MEYFAVYQINNVLHMLHGTSVSCWFSPTMMNVFATCAGLRPLDSVDLPAHVLIKRTSMSSKAFIRECIAA